MADILSQARELVELGKKSSPGLWVAEGRYDWSFKAQEGTSERAIPYDIHDAEFIAACGNHAPDIAKALLEAVGFIRRLSERPTSEDGIVGWRIAARDFLKRVGGE
ncbi:MAG: hypothetical protein K6T83_14325 [Alicyclobacillus sp.]|nr:hypothetical protein [Alicyclobacillus sp.]